MGPAQILDSMLTDGRNDAFSGLHSGWHREGLVKKLQMTRQEQDAFSARSQQRFAATQESDAFADEIVSVEVKGRKGTESFNRDEAPRPETTVDTLARLKPAFRLDGTITAGNAPGLSATRSIRRLRKDPEPSDFQRFVAQAASCLAPLGFAEASPSCVSS